MSRITVTVPDDFDRRKRLQDDILASISRFCAGDRLTRDEVHQRRPSDDPSRSA